VIKQPLFLSHNELIFCGEMGWLVKAGRETNRKMAFLYCYIYPDIALIRLQTTNSIRKASGDGLTYDL
jgi:hypothetical protein